MILKINTSAKAVEVTNFIIAQAISSLENNQQHMEAFKLSNSDLKKIESFRRSLVKGYMKEIKK